MATKLKNMSRKWYLKGAAFLIILITILAAGYIVYENCENINLYALEYEGYEYSPLFYNDIEQYVNNVRIVAEGGSIEAIQNGDYEDEVRGRLKEPYEEWKSWEGGVNIYFDDNNPISYTYEYLGKEEERQIEDLSYETFLQMFPELEEETKEALIQLRTAEFEETLRYLKNHTDFVYQVTEKENHEAVLKSFENYPIYGYIPSYGQAEANNDRLRAILHEFYPQDKEIFIGITSSWLVAMNEEWMTYRGATFSVLTKLLAAAAILFLLILYLLIVTGRRPGEEKVHLYALDRIWSEVIWIAGGFCFIFIVLFLSELGYHIMSPIDYESFDYLLFFLYLAAVAIVSVILLECGLTQARRLKAKKFLDGFLCIRLTKKAWKIAGKVWRNGTLSKRALFLAVALPILCATWVGAPFVITLLVYLIYKYMGDFVEITEGTKKIKNGNLTYKIELKSEEGMLKELAEDINSISQGLKAAVSSELKSERLKSELISNVSHDLKTPLTSIVTYVDLLKQEEMPNEAARDYIDVIDRKAKRLTVLTNDLFEAAKASSGDMPVNLEKVDLNALIRQALGEFDERLTLAGLEIRMKLLDNSAYILADGKLTWRVLDNLLTNVVKYGQNGSRVYLEVEEEENEIRFTMKNISAYELNIPTDELMERFTRGDESRNSEGSGLGLSIANSLISLQHGDFLIEIDGDLFKVIFTLPKYKEHKPKPEPEPKPEK